MTDSARPSEGSASQVSAAAYVPDPERVAAIAEAEARLSEGFCPFCNGRLSPLSDYDRERTKEWWSPPTAACLSCERVVGRYPNGGVHGSTLHHLDSPTPPRAEVSAFINTNEPEAKGA